MSDKEWELSEPDLAVIRFVVQAVGAFLFVGAIALDVAAIVFMVRSPSPGGANPAVLAGLAVVAVGAFAGLKAIRLADKP